METRGPCYEDEMDQSPTLGQSSDSRTNVSQTPTKGSMQLLEVPGSASPVSSCSRDAKFLRRYSCNPGKGSHSHLDVVGSSSALSAAAAAAGGSTSNSPMARRSSLAAIKWSVLARRISMGLAHEREPPEDPAKAVAEVNTQVAILRDLLIHIGQSRDGPEMREKIRRIRRQSIEACRHAVQIILHQIHTEILDHGLPMDFSPQLVLLFFCTQLLHKELRKCKRLVLKLPIDMSSHYDNHTRPGTSNFAGVLSQIILCRQINPDFNAEEICSIEKDTEEISSLLEDMQEFMPKNTQDGGFTYEEVFGRRPRRSRMTRNSWCDFEYLCCISKNRRLSSGL